ncbi:MAG: tetratricopeptide repeat protein [Nitrospirae bacterium]|nr:tetratricopeptide repeat protein [Nitrospirota bacterium]
MFSNLIRRIISKQYILLLLTVAAFGIYANALNGGLVWDDHYYVSRFPLRFNSLSSLFLPTDLKGAIMVFYRPLIGLTYLLDYSVWFDKPLGYHLTNIIFHTVNTVLLYFITDKIFKSVTVAFWAAMLFAVHPIHTESVSWIAGRTDIVATAFVFLSMLAHTEFKEKNNKKAIIPATLFFALAMFSKEIAIGAIIVFAMYDLLISGQKGLEPLPYICYGAVIILYLIMRQLYLANTVMEMSFKSFPDMLTIFFSSMAFYLYKFFYPIGLSLYISEIPYKALFLIAGIFLSAISVFLFINFIKKKRIYFFLIASFFITIMPSIFGAFTTVLSPPFAERYLYLPSAFLCIGIAYSALKLGKYSGYLIIPVFLVFALLTYNRNGLWKSELLLWKDTVEKTNHWYPKSEYARTLLSQGKLNEALKASEESLSQAISENANAKSLSKIYNNIGRVYVEDGNSDTAAVYFNKSIESSKTNPIPYHNLGEILLAKAKNEKNNRLFNLKQAESYFTKAIENDPYLFESYLGLGEVFFMSGDFKSAEFYYLKVIKLSPNTPYSAEAVKGILRPEMLKVK